MNPLKTPLGTTILGVVFTLIFIFAMKTGNSNPIEWTVWFHTVVGITWIGLLYYFNFIQVPAVNAALADKEPGPAAINKYVAPRALLYFRYAALLTWLSGAAILFKLGILHQAFALQGISEGSPVAVIGIGAWLGTIMLFNVWVLIWPNQQKLLGMKEATDAEKATAKFVALMASRTNTALSLPMLVAMTAYGHGMPL